MRAIFQLTGIGVSAHDNISIVNLLGAQVANIFSGELDVAPHTFTWNPVGLPDGMYECLVRMNGRVEKTAVMLMR